MRCTRLEMHYLLLGNCPGCNPEGYASLFSGSLEPEGGQQSSNVEQTGADIPADL